MKSTKNLTMELMDISTVTTLKEKLFSKLEMPGYGCPKHLDKIEQCYARFKGNLFLVSD